MHILQRGGENSVAEASAVLTEYRPIVYLDVLVFRYEKIGDTPEGKRIAETYERVTGDDIRQRIWELRDLIAIRFR